MDAFAEAGLGLDRDALAFGRTTAAWLAVGEQLRDRVARALGDLVTDVETIGSSSVLGLLAKPIVDLAVGLDADRPFDAVRAELVADGWIHRGDAGDDGGQVFVLETRPGHRVAHLHGVAYDGAQWRNYLRLREILRRDPDARSRYEAVKRELARGFVDRRAYTDGKTAVVTSLLVRARVRSRPATPRTRPDGGTGG